jgi:hypothetical protein
MKTNKVIVGAVAAMLSLSVCSVAPVIAASDTVQISVGTDEVAAGEQFTVDVAIKGVPSTKIQGCEFAIKYDPSLISVDSIKAGAITETGASGKDQTASYMPVFDVISNDSDGYATVVWATSLTDSTYWISQDGVFCTISGTASKNAPDNTVAEIEILPIDRDLTSQSGVKNQDIRIGYIKDSKPVAYTVQATNGAVKIGSGTSDVLYGDANCDGTVDISDAVLIMQNQANPEKYVISKQGLLNADCVDNPKGVTSTDALAVQMIEAKTFTQDKLPVTSDYLQSLQ